MRGGRLSVPCSRELQFPRLGFTAHRALGTPKAYSTPSQTSKSPEMAVGLGSAESGTDVVKPIADRRSYEHLELDNGVRFLLVSDPDAVFAAACANVQAVSKGAGLLPACLSVCIPSRRKPPDEMWSTSCCST